MLPPADRPRRDPPDRDGATRRYDSFVVRLWSAPNAAYFLRAEVRHVQTNLAESAVDVDPGWLLDAILGCLGPERATSESIDR